MKTKLILLFLLSLLLTLTNSLLPNINTINNPGKSDKKVEDEILTDDQIPQNDVPSVPANSEASKKEKTPSLVIGQDENENEGGGEQGMFFDYDDGDEDDGHDGFHHEDMAEFLNNMF